jgi:hypothetical protein
METSFNTTEKPTSKSSKILPSNYHLTERQYAGCVQIGPTLTYTKWFDSAWEAALELRCLEKRLSYELVKTVECEGYFPERAIIMEEKYQQSGRTNGLYTGLHVKDGTISDDTSN